MIEILKTERFTKWLDHLTDLRARARIQTRIEHLKIGHTGDAKPVGGSVKELRIDIGPGYRVYFTHRGQEIVLLLCGGDKSTQSNDIKIAINLAKQLKEGS